MVHQEIDRRLVLQKVETTTTKIAKRKDRARSVEPSERSLRTLQYGTDAGRDLDERINNSKLLESSTSNTRRRSTSQSYREGFDGPFSTHRISSNVLYANGSSPPSPVPIVRPEHQWHGHFVTDSDSLLRDSRSTHHGRPASQDQNRARNKNIIYRFGSENKDFLSLPLLHADERSRSTGKDTGDERFWREERITEQYEREETNRPCIERPFPSETHQTNTDYSAARLKHLGKDIVREIPVVNSHLPFHPQITRVIDRSDDNVALQFRSTESLFDIVRPRTFYTSTPLQDERLGQNKTERQACCSYKLNTFA